MAPEWTSVCGSDGSGSSGDDGSTGGVDEHGGRLHLGELLGADHVAGLVGQRDVQINTSYEVKTSSGEETAVELMRAGAHDYLLKPSIVNATFDYWSRQTQGIAPLTKTR